MGQYLYEITNGEKTQQGKIYADSLEEASIQIKKPGWYISSLRDERDIKKSFIFASAPKFPMYDKINFTDHLASSIGAGTPLQEALDAYVEAGDRKSEVIDTISKDIQRGKKLSEAMAKHPTIFSPLYIALVQAGEISGSLDETLDYLSTELRREHEFISKVKSAMFYPIVVLSVSLLVVTLIIGVVVPKIVTITKNFGGDLPAITKFMVAVAEFLTNNLVAIIAVLGLMVFGIIRVIRSDKFKTDLNKYIIRAPLIGSIIRQFILARFLRIVGGCIKYGIQLPKALELAAAVVNNDVYKKSCENINKKIMRGQNLSLALADEDQLLFPPIISRTIKGGEKTSKLDVGLMRLSVYYETEVDRNLKQLTELIEPVMIVGLGILVALIAISVIAPIYQMTSRIK